MLAMLADNPGYSSCLAMLSMNTGRLCCLAVYAG
jgi:hypothetical protein